MLVLTFRKTVHRVPHLTLTYHIKDVNGINFNNTLFPAKSVFLNKSCGAILLLVLEHREFGFSTSSTGV